MTSIIKVDQIQNAAGGVPTASDLGLNVSRSVLQSVTTEVTSSVSNTTITTTSLAAASLTAGSITVKDANSVILVTLYIGRSLVYALGGVGYSLYYSNDNSSYSVIPNSNAGNLYGFNYSTSGENQIPIILHADHTHGQSAGSTVYFKLYTRSWTGNSQRDLSNDGAGGTVHWNIQEIAG